VARLLASSLQEAICRYQLLRENEFELETTGLWRSD
jgi:hypothetical protein